MICTQVINPLWNQFTHQSNLIFISLKMNEIYKSIRKQLWLHSLRRYHGQSRIFWRDSAGSWTSTRNTNMSYLARTLGWSFYQVTFYSGAAGHVDGVSRTHRLFESSETRFYEAAAPSILLCCDGLQTEGPETLLKRNSRQNATWAFFVWMYMSQTFV